MRLGWLLLVACTRAQPEPVHDTVAPPVVGDVEIAYRTWGLMPASCSATYEILVARDREFACGWLSTCPPYSKAAPLVPAPKGQLTAAQVNRLAELASGAPFRALPKFDTNIHIIDGGEEQFEVTVAGRTQIVELANLDRPPFSALRDALQLATRCSIKSAGPAPHD